MENIDMNKSNFIIVLLLAMIFSTSASSNQHSRKYQRMLNEEWAKVCQRDVSCKWDNQCTYKSSPIMKYHCERTTKNVADMFTRVRELNERNR